MGIEAERKVFDSHGKCDLCGGEALPLNCDAECPACYAEYEDDDDAELYDGGCAWERHQMGLSEF